MEPPIQGFWRRSSPAAVGMEDSLIFVCYAGVGGGIRACGEEGLFSGKEGGKGGRNTLTYTHTHTNEYVKTHRWQALDFTLKPLVEATQGARSPGQQYRVLDVLSVRGGRHKTVREWGHSGTAWHRREGRETVRQPLVCIRQSERSIGGEMKSFPIQGI